MRVIVTARDVARGVRGDSCKCPVALAVSRVAGKRAYVMPSDDLGAGSVTLMNYDDEQSRTLALPAFVDETAAEFDRTGKMEPFVFDLPGL